MNSYRYKVRIRKPEARVQMPKADISTSYNLNIIILLSSYPFISLINCPWLLFSERGPARREGAGKGGEKRYGTQYLFPFFSFYSFPCRVPPPLDGRERRERREREGREPKRRARINISIPGVLCYYFLKETMQA